MHIGPQAVAPVSLKLGARALLQWRFVCVIRRRDRFKRTGRDGCGCSSGVEHNLAKVGVEGSNPFARSSFYFNPPRSPSQNGRSAERVNSSSDIDLEQNRLSSGPIALHDTAMSG